MLRLADSLKQTRFYQEGIEELVLRQLNRRVGELSPTLKTQIEALPIEHLEDLGEALLDFTDRADLVSWLQANTVDS